MIRAIHLSLEALLICFAVAVAIGWAQMVTALVTP